MLPLKFDKVCFTRNWNQGKAVKPGYMKSQSLLYSKLESRQSSGFVKPSKAKSLLYSKLESRQSCLDGDSLLFIVCFTRNWNQGKAKKSCRTSVSSVCFTRNWNQGKALIVFCIHFFQFALLEIGIKAKQLVLNLNPFLEFALLEIGIKAKLAS